jgi:predicted O-linked N-acetylglucosamine transferase (SPINDLY family)
MNLSIPDALGRAQALLSTQQWAAAEAICQAVLQVAPEVLDAHLLVGVARYMAGDMPEAEAACRRAIELCRTSDQAWTNLAATLAVQERWSEAEAAYRQALELNPAQAVAHFNLGRMLHRQAFLLEALEAYNAALAINPQYAKAEYNRALVYQDLGRFDEAERGYRQALAVQPDFVEAANNLGNLFREQGRLDAAEQCYRDALQQSPGVFTARVNLGLTLCECGRLAEAHQAFIEAHAARPAAIEPMGGLATVCRAAGRIEDAEHWLRQATAVSSDPGGLESTLLFLQQYRSGVTAAELAATHRRWDERYAAPLRSSWTPPADQFDPERRLRVGFVSADLAEHPVGFLLIGVLEALRPLCDTVCYYDRARRDAMVERFQRAAGEWRETRAWSDERLAREIRRDRIDVLVDLAGHSGDQRLMVFARKPAPIQATWLGYPGTTGLQAMDYLIADRHQVPEGEDEHYREQVLRLPDSYTALAPLDAPAVGPLPATITGRLTLGCFNNPAKISAPAAALWARVLGRLPAARLLLKYPGLDDPLAGDRIRQLFAAQGISADRLQLEGRAPRAELLAAYNRVDIALDTLPYSGGMTTLEALWMGTPVVTLPGRTFAGRHALSYLSTAGLCELVASDEAGYIQRVVALAGDLPRLTHLRQTLRTRVAGSPLGDPARLARHLIELLSEAWRRRCAAASPGSGETR